MQLNRPEAKRERLRRDGHLETPTRWSSSRQGGRTEDIDGAVIIRSSSLEVVGLREERTCSRLKAIKSIEFIQCLDFGFINSCMRSP